MTSSAWYAQHGYPVFPHSSSVLVAPSNWNPQYNLVPFSASLAPALGSSSIGISSRGIGFTTGVIEPLEETQITIHQQSFADIFNPPCDSNRVIIKLCESMKKEWK